VQVCVRDQYWASRQATVLQKNIRIYVYPQAEEVCAGDEYLRNTLEICHGAIYIHIYIFTCCSVLQCVAVCCSVLQRYAMVPYTYIFISLLLIYVYS